MRKVEVVPYDPAWPIQAAAEGRRLQGALGEVALAVDHVGSTSVPGLSAKPTLDFLVVVPSLAALEAREVSLVALGYEPRGEMGVPGRRYYRMLRGEAHTHHVHCFAEGHPEIARHLAFRDALRADPELARAYGELKHDLAARFPEDPASYTEGKTAFITGVVSRALNL